MLISAVEKGSIADELGLKKGDLILSVNGKSPKDIIEYSFLEHEENLVLNVKKVSEISTEGSFVPGEFEIFEIEKDSDEDLGISFEQIVFDGIKPCVNKCIFCFVDQQPEGLRKSLYIKDDDWRLSYFQGTYITLTNFTETDWQRLKKLRLSPLYVSVHSTNPIVREKMLRNKRAGNILEDLKRLKELKIDIHAQIVLCPGYNDEEELQCTLNDLESFKKNLKSLAVVPVGVSKYRGENLKTVDKTIAQDTIKRLNNFNARLRKNIAMASDELFLLAEYDIPEKNYYGKFSQIEDGVGAVRLFLDSFNQYKQNNVFDKIYLKSPKKLTLATGSTAYKVFCSLDIKIPNLELELLEVKNSFFGDKINVAGLVTGSDILKTLEGRNVSNLVVPNVMLREGTQEFLDGITLNDIREKTKAQIFVVKDCYSFKEIVTIIKSL